MAIEPQEKGLVLAEGRFLICYESHAIPCDCRVTFDLNRANKVLIECLESLHDLGSGFALRGLDSEKPFFLEIAPDALQVKCGVFHLNEQMLSTDPRLKVTLWPQGPVLFPARSIVRVNAAIINLPQYWFGGPNKLAFCLEDQTWVFRFTPVGDRTFQYPPAIQNESFSFSHHLLMQRKSGQPFSHPDGEKALETLSTFLSFCAEGWIAATLVTGIDESGLIALQEWRTPMVDSRRPATNWLDEYHGAPMIDVFRGFSRLMEEPKWRDTIRTAIYWYVRAQSDTVGPDGGIILVQAALERMAWHLLVQQQKAISQNGFSKLPAAGQIRLLLNSSSIPLALPTSLKALTAIAKERKWSDGPETFVGMRNQIVHPPRRAHSKASGNSYYEALQLGKWYLELVLLRMTGFVGTYSNRVKYPMWKGEVEPLPRS